MRKFTDLSLAVESLTVERQALLRFHVTKGILADWSISLQLLQDGLVDAVLFRRIDSSEKIELCIATENQSHVNEYKDRVVVSLTKSDLDYIRSFFLRYYRDGVAEVDHLDIQNSDGGYTTFCAEQSVPPVSAGEAKRRLNME